MWSDTLSPYERNSSQKKLYVGHKKFAARRENKKATNALLILTAS